MVLDVIFAVITFIHLESSMSALVGWSTGYLENTFAWFFMPFMYWILNEYGKIFSLKWSSLGFENSRNDLSPNIFRRGWWSTMIVNIGDPNKNSLAFSKAHATAKASPSIGAYFDSAGVKNRLWQKASFQPSAQHVGILLVFLQEQCCCITTKPIPCFDQSVITTVFFLIS